MSEYTLVVGNKNYSSWSLRGWLAAKQSGIEFEEIVVRLSEPDLKPDLLEHSPSGLVPVLKHQDRVIWESLAIIEYLAEQREEARLWPADDGARAFARSVSAEMHAGFRALRSNMPMNLRKSLPGKGRRPGVAEDIERICQIWRECRGRFGKGGPFLFGHLTGADAMYAPVATRFRTYAVELDPTCQTYADAVLALPAYQQWHAAAVQEPWIIPEDEVE
jgi:glutathione S-transferase